MKKRSITVPKDEVLTEARALARLHTPDALEELARLARDGKSETVRVAAIKEILDRAHGRPPASLDEGAGGLRYVLVDDGYRD